MSNEELERAMQFILDQQAKHESEIQDLRTVNKTIQENQQKLQEGQEKLQEGQKVLMEIVTKLAVQADEDYTQLSSSIAALNTALIRFEVVVEKEREETRARLDRLEVQADKDREEMRSAVDKLVGAISNVHRRVSHLEDKEN